MAEVVAKTPCQGSAAIRIIVLATFTVIDTVKCLYLNAAFLPNPSHAVRYMAQNERTCHERQTGDFAV
jgi:hypothetical protein